jgi:hypothetical protein
VMWSEFEANHTWWPDGVRKGKSQLFLTPGIVFGPIPISGRVKFAIGAGYQFAVTPRTPAFNNNVILSFRLYF